MVVHLIISGRVQGVGYRQWLRRQAEARGVSGWVRNRLDETVEAVLAGEAAAVEAVAVAAMNGPLGAKVDRIDRRPAEAGAWNEGAQQGVEIRPTV